MAYSVGDRVRMYDRRVGTIVRLDDEGRYIVEQIDDPFLERAVVRDCHILELVNVPKEEPCSLCKRKNDAGRPCWWCGTKQ